VTSGVADRSRQRITGDDVALEAGVSRATVSYVLNNTPHQTIPETTRQRVLAAAARLGYAPSAAARTLSRGRSDVVLYLLPPHLRLNTQFGDLLEHLSTALAEAGLTLVVHPWSRDLRPVTAVWSALSPVAVLAQHLDDNEIQTMHDAGVQVVHSLLTTGDALTRWVRSVQDDICQQQVQALVVAGHRRLTYAMPDDERLRAEIELRREGVRRACAERGLPAPVVSTVPADLNAAAAIISSWRALRRPVTGVCAYDDTTALTLLAALRGQGLTAPADLALVGVYDIPTARLAEPPLTTVAIDSQAMAQYAAATLLRRLDGKAARRQAGPLVTQLVARRTV
jgi:DNA-binding LacI/PurR family transcriptional regulator